MRPAGIVPTLPPPCPCLASPAAHPVPAPARSRAWAPMSASASASAPTQTTPFGTEKFPSRPAPSNASTAGASRNRTACSTTGWTASTRPLTVRRTNNPREKRQESRRQLADGPTTAMFLVLTGVTESSLVKWKPCGEFPIPARRPPTARWSEQLKTPSNPRTRRRVARLRPRNATTTIFRARRGGGRHGGGSVGQFHLASIAPALAYLGQRARRCLPRPAAGARPGLAAHSAMARGQPVADRRAAAMSTNAPSRSMAPVAWVFWSLRAGPRNHRNLKTIAVAGRKGFPAKSG